MPESSQFVDRLTTEVEAWEKEGLIAHDQAESILARYGLSGAETVQSLRRAKLVYVAAVLGVVLVGVGVVLLVGSNWEGMSRWLRVGILAVATVASYVGGYRLTYVSARSPRIGMALLLLGSLIWGASIFLIGQMYSSGGGDGERAAVMYWFLGVAPLAYILRSRLHLALALVVGSIWFGMLIFSPLMEEPASVMLSYLALGVALYAVGRIHRGRPSIAALELPYRWLGLLYAITPMYLFSFRTEWLEPGRHISGAGLGVVLGLGAAAVLALLAMWRMVRDSRYEAAGLAALTVLYFVMWFNLSTSSEGMWIGMAVSNFLLIALELGMIGLGWMRSEPGLANLGVLIFFIQVVTRYFDLFGRMLPSGLLFIGAGLLLVFGGAALEKSRRRLMSAMEERSQG